MDRAQTAKRKYLLVKVFVIPVFVIVILAWIGATTHRSSEPAEVGSAIKAQVPPRRMWVSKDRAIRRTCPSISCGKVGEYFFREAADVAEISNGWARVSKYYDAACESGASTYVDDGNSACTTENGIAHGQFAEWVQLDALSSVRPPDPAESAKGIAALVGQSDDFGRYQDKFVRAAQQLIAEGKCTKRDISEMGGFVKSMNRKGAIYFTYCGGMTIKNRIYLDVSSGRIFK